MTYAAKIGRGRRRDRLAAARRGDRAANSRARSGARAPCACSTAPPLKLRVAETTARATPATAPGDGRRAPARPASTSRAATRAPRLRITGGAAGGRQADARGRLSARAAAVTPGMRVRAPRGSHMHVEQQQAARAVPRAGRHDACATRSPPSTTAKRTRGRALVPSSRTARCGITARSMRSRARSRTSRSPTRMLGGARRASRSISSSTRARRRSPSSIGRSTPQRRSRARRRRAGQRAAAPVPARARRAGRGASRGEPVGALVASALVDRARRARIARSTGKRSSTPGNARPPLTLRVNLRATSRDALARALRRQRNRRATPAGAQGHRRRRRRDR